MITDIVGHLDELRNRVTGGDNQKSEARQKFDLAFSALLLRSPVFSQRRQAVSDIADLIQYNVVGHSWQTEDHWLKP